MSVRHLFVCIAVVLAGGASAVSARTWTSTDGKQVDAEFQKIDGEDIVLKAAVGGKVLRIPISKFSAADVHFARLEQEAKDKPKPDPCAATKRRPEPANKAPAEPEAVNQYGKLAAAGAINLPPGGSRLLHLHFSADGQQLLIPYGNALFVADVEKRKPKQVALLQRGRVVLDAIACPDGAGYALGTDDGHVVIVDPKGKIVKEFPAHVNKDKALGTSAGRTQGLGYSPDRTILVTLGMEGAIRFWDAKTYEAKGMIRSDLDNMTLEFQPKGPFLSTCTVHHGEVRLIEWRRARLVKGFPPDTRGGAFSADETQMAMTGDSLRIWDLKKNKFVAELKNEGLPCLGNTAWLPDGKHVLSGRDNELLVWNVEDNKIVGRYPAKPSQLTAMNLSPDGTLIATGLSDQRGVSLRLWRFEAKQ